MKVYNVELKNIADVNMSNWQITHVVNSFTVANNKFDVLNKMNKLINDGMDKKNIFIVDKSFSFNTNYSTYFDGDFVNDRGNYIDVQKLFYMGNFTPMESSETLQKINILFEVFKRLNSVFSNNFKMRLKTNLLVDAFDSLIKNDIEQCMQELIVDIEDMMLEIYQNQKKPDYNEMNTLLNKFKGIVDKYKFGYKDTIKDLNANTKEKFEELFNSLSRPIIGTFDEETNRFDIINAEQMYLNGELADRQIRLRKVEKNSPVLIVFATVGAMSGLLSYLAYRSYQVDLLSEEAEEDNTIPDSDSKAVSNVLSSSEGVALNNMRNIETDEDIQRLGLNNFKKMVEVTDKKMKIDITAIPESE